MKPNPPEAPDQLTGASGAAGAERSLAELILAGDPDALAGFFDARESSVRSFCVEASPAELVEEACAAARIDFIGRLRTAREQDLSRLDLDELLLKATRSATAGRFKVQAPPLAAGRRGKWTGRPVDQATCQVMPELLAGGANGELSAGAEQLRPHVRRCPTCQGTAARMQRAERAFAEAFGVQRR
ncbi:MAG: hypothetical protein ACR2IP_10175 [Solirubrobacteraceae bacterium]